MVYNEINQISILTLHEGDKMSTANLGPTDNSFKHMNKTEKSPKIKDKGKEKPHEKKTKRVSHRISSSDNQENQPSSPSTTSSKMKKTEKRANLFKPLISKEHPKTIELGASFGKVEIPAFEEHIIHQDEMREFLSDLRNDINETRQGLWDLERQAKLKASNSSKNTEFVITEFYSGHQKELKEFRDKITDSISKIQALAEKIPIDQIPTILKSKNMGISVDTVEHYKEPAVSDENVEFFDQTFATIQHIVNQTSGALALYNRLTDKKVLKEFLRINNRKEQLATEIKETVQDLSERGYKKADIKKDKHLRTLISEQISLDNLQIEGSLTAQYEFTADIGLYENFDVKSEVDKTLKSPDVKKFYTLADAFEDKIDDKINSFFPD